MNLYKRTSKRRPFSNVANVSVVLENMKLDESKTPKGLNRRQPPSNSELNKENAKELALNPKGKRNNNEKTAKTNLKSSKHKEVEKPKCEVDKFKLKPVVNVVKLDISKYLNKQSVETKTDIKPNKPAAKTLNLSKSQLQLPLNPPKTVTSTKATKMPELVVNIFRLSDTKTEQPLKRGILKSKNDLNVCGKSLRHRKKIDYLERSTNGNTSKEASSIENTPSTTKHVPIYLQASKKSPVKKRKLDLYEFDNDSDEEKKRKRQRESDYDECNKSIHELLKKLEEKEKHDKRTNVRNFKKKTNAAKSTAKKGTEKVANKQNVAVKLFDTASKASKPPKTVQTTLVINKADTNNKPALINVNKNTKDNIKTQAQLPQAVHFDDCNSFFDFDDSNSEIASEPNDSVADNVKLKSPRKFINESVLSNELLKSPVTPWRSFIPSITRNPHILQIKSSSCLPNNTQDMIIDATFVERSEMHSKTPRRIDTELEISHHNSPAVQTSILNYVSTNKESNNDNLNISTLFDCGDFSPIKSQVDAANSQSVLQSIDMNQTRSSARRNLLQSTPNVAEIKRRKSSKSPLGKNALNKENEAEIVVNENENIPHETHVIKNVPEKKTPKKTPKKFTLDDYFGFNESSENEKSVKKKVAFDPKTTRISVNLIKNVLKPKIDDVVNHDDDKNDLNGDVNNDVSDVYNDIVTEDGEAHCEPRLFEDLEITFTEPTERKYRSKRSKRRPQPVYESEESEDDEEFSIKKKPTKKEIRNKAEEVEADKWAAAFNSMCEEIDQFPLVIE